MFAPSPLSVADIHDIRLFHDEGWTKIRGNLAALTACYGVARCTLQSIGSRYHYKNLPERWRTGWQRR